MNGWNRTMLIMLAMALLLAAAVPLAARQVRPALAGMRAAPAEEGGFQEYVVRPGDTLSGIAGRLLHNARQWRLLLKYNRIANPNLIFPGQRIVIPVADRARAEAAIRAAQAARAAGGPSAEGDDLLNSALAAFNDSNFGLAYGLAERARRAFGAPVAAHPAVMVPAPLSVASVAGECFHQVAGHEPVLLRPGMQVSEGSEVLTGPEGRVRLTFSDGSSVSVGEAARLRLLQTRVTMAGEGVYHGELFAGTTEWSLNSANGTWQVDGAGASAQLQGSAAAVHVRHGRMAVSAWQGSIRVLAADGAVNVPAGHGLVLRPGEAPGAPVALPAAATLVALGGNDLGYRAGADAAMLRLEVARDRDCSALLLSERFPVGESFDLGDLAEGDYWLRLSTQTADGLYGLPGAPLAWREDRTAPPLAVARPAGTMLNAGPLEVTGRTEPGASVTVNGVMAQMTGDGGFSASLDLAAGVTVLLVEAVDAAGNRSQWLRAVHVPGEAPRYLADSNRLVTTVAQMPVTMPVAGGRVLAGGQTVTANSSVILVPLAQEGENQLAFSVPTALGMRECRTTVVRDQAAPRLLGTISITTYPPAREGGDGQLKAVIRAEDAGIGLAGQAFADFYSSTDRRYRVMLPYDASEGGYCAITEINAADVDAEITCEFVQLKDRLNNTFELGIAGGSAHATY